MSLPLFDDFSISIISVLECCTCLPSLDVFNFVQCNQLIFMRPWQLEKTTTILYLLDACYVNKLHTITGVDGVGWGEDVQQSIDLHEAMSLPPSDDFSISIISVLECCTSLPSLDVFVQCLQRLGDLKLLEVLPSNLDVPKLGQEGAVKGTHFVTEKEWSAAFFWL